jgi:hypothetical protein
VSRAHDAPPAPRDAAAIRDVAVHYAFGPAMPGFGGRRWRAAAVEAVGVILGDLGAHPDSLIVRTVQCGGPTPALLLAPAGRARPARVVAFIPAGLSELELQLGLMWWATHGADDLRRRARDAEGRPAPGGGDAA